MRVMTSSDGKLRAVGYTRVSTEDQQTRLDDDRARIDAACTAYGYELVEFIKDEGVSGKTPLHERPNGCRIAALIEQRHGRQVDVLVVSSLDRLSRETTDGLDLIKRLVPNGRRDPLQLLALDDHVDLTGATGRLFAKFKILLGEFERELIGERTSNALNHKRRTGQSFSREPFGWDQVGGKGGRLIRNEREQGVLASMQAWRSAGVNDHAIATRLNAAGVPSKRGGRWQANTVYRILGNVGNIGSEASL